VSYQLLPCSVVVRDVMNYFTGSSMEKRLGNADLGTHQRHCWGGSRHSAHFTSN